jgi:transcriptional regulator with XRE-family HTH domain
VKKDKVLVAIATVVRAAREGRNWSQEDLADKAGIHRTYIGFVERAERNISVKKLILIAETLGLKASRLLDEAGL